MNLLLSFMSASIRVDEKECSQNGSSQLQSLHPRRQRKEDCHELKDSLGYNVKLCFKTKKCEVPPS